jgi:3'(2'), 5'-bisphosphate nucleotidase
MNLDCLDIVEQFCSIRKNLRETMLLKYKKKSLLIKLKEDKSPVTEADILVNKFLLKKLKNIFPCPVVSEESSFFPEIFPDLWWLVDPIDGTKNFIKETNQFCCLVSLLKKDKVVLSLIYSPCDDLLYFTFFAESSYKIDSLGTKTVVNCRKPSSDAYKFIQGESRSKKDLANVKKELIKEVTNFGSALKFCKIAEGQADIYVKEGFTAIWDTVAGQHFLENAGGKVVGFNSKRLTLHENKFSNPGFVACADNSLDISSLFC